MAALVWLLIPLTAAIGTVIWSVWASREPSSAGDAEGVAGYEAFRAAMERPSGPRGNGRGRAGRAAAPVMARSASGGRARAAD